MRNQLKQLRSLLKTQKIDYLILPNNDPFASEYLPESEKRIEFLTSFDGSNAILVVKKTGRNAFFTDGRYTLQASKQLSKKEFDIFDLSQKSLIKYLVENVKKGEKVVIDGNLHSKKQASLIKGHIDLLKGSFKTLKTNPVDEFWVKRPEAPNNELFLFPEKYSGEKMRSKIKKILDLLDKDTDALFLNFAPSVNWLLNIRSSDVECTPLALCYCLIHKDGRVDLFVKENRITKKVRDYFSKNKIDVIDPKNLNTHLKLSKQQLKKVQIDPDYLNFSLFESLIKQKIEITEKTDPILALKAIKNEVEIKNNINTHKQDGLALTKFLYWIENNKKTDEISAANRLLEFRSECSDFLYPSFETISSFGPNGSIIHYKVNEKTNKKFGKNNLYLVDSGGQYFGGTTDVTRTVAIGKPNKDHIANFTRVLKGHISIARTKFPIGTKGSNLDILARIFLWRDLKDYAHGTGHGVGQFLSVHESPPSISKKGGDSALEPGMILSNEPGYYENGKYGIRIENLMLVKSVKNTKFLEFKTLTLAPIDPKLIDFKMITYPEKQWLKNYHKEIYKTLSKDLSKEQNDWLKNILAIYAKA